MATPSSPEEITDIYETAVSVAKEAGKMALKAFHQDKKIETKESRCDLVTETDQLVEDFIIGTLKKKYPHHWFIGEESVAAGKQCQFTDEPTWLIDPIDGTTNFVHKFPFVAVSIGFYIQKQPVVGVVYNLVTDQMYAARKGAGATLNGSPISVTKCKDIQSALIIAEFSADRVPERLRTRVNTMYDIAANYAHGVRSVGSAALDLCLVASGSSDAYVEYGLHCWDMAAGVLILTEAGGVVMMPQGETLDIMKRGVLAASSTELALQIVPHVKHIDYPSD